MTTSAPAHSARETVADIGISHPARIVYPELGATKLDVARYYHEVGDWMVPHLAGRPLTLLRCPQAVARDADKGGCFMMRHSKVWGPSALRRVEIEELRKTGEYLVADSREALVALAQMDVVEVHTWNSRAETPYQHDRVVFDLDPGPEVAWTQTVTAAKLVRRILSGLGLRSWLKTTGGKGLHVVMPIEPTDTAACLAFARTVAGALIQHDPALFTVASAKAGRRGQILIDALRNSRTNTPVAAYSLRARPGAPVSMPLRWDELTPRLDPARFTLTSVARRLSRISDPWSDYWSTRQRLPDAAR
jgi:bifunctional non-homologous end joining protein LigD